MADLTALLTCPAYGKLSSETLSTGRCVSLRLVELGSLDPGVLSAPRERALRNRGQVAIGLRCVGLSRHGSLRGDGVFAALGKNLFDLGVRAGDDVY